MSVSRRFPQLVTGWHIRVWRHIRGRRLVRVATRDREVINSVEIFQGFGMVLNKAGGGVNLKRHCQSTSERLNHGALATHWVWLSGSPKTCGSRRCERVGR